MGGELGRSFRLVFPRVSDCICCGDREPDFARRGDEEKAEEVSLSLCGLLMIVAGADSSGKVEAEEVWGAGEAGGEGSEDWRRLAAGGGGRRVQKLVGLEEKGC